MSKTNSVVILTTVAKRKQADELASSLLKKKLIACCNIVGPIISHYRWKEKLAKDSEFLLVLKTKRERIKALETELHRIHPYELPEFIVLPITAGSSKYLKWIASEVELPSGRNGQADS